MTSALDIARPYSPFLSRLLDNGLLDAADLTRRIAQPLTTEDFAVFADWEGFQAASDEAGLAQALRRLRRLVMAHIMVRDLARLSDLAEVTGTITRFADFAINRAADFAHAYYVDFYGEPIGQYSHAPQRLSVIAMGKMGGFELNVSSDIDLIFIYPESGETDGKRSRSNQEFFTKVGQKLIALLNDVTADGQVFRVDMRLRPDGDSGPLVMSEAALEHYLITQGREWERYAWTKARVVTPYAGDVATLVRPFVYRKYLDFNAYEAMRALHRQIRQEVERKGMENNVKLGAGGIREVEFIAQIFQLIRGGQIKALQLKGTQETLLKLAELHLLEDNDAEVLLAAYRFLRDVEHRLQYWEDCQTQTLPESAAQQTLLAHSMGFADYAAFSGSLNDHRAAVNALFNAILSEPESEESPDTHLLAAVWHSADEALLAEYGFDNTAGIAARLIQMRDGKKYTQLSAQAGRRFDQLMPQVIETASRFPPRRQTLFRLLDLLDAIIRRSAYLALLHEHPESLAQLAAIMSQSAWVSDYLMRHPILLDELLSAQLKEKDTDHAAAEAQLSAELAACNQDVEEEMDVLRHFQHARIFRLSVQDLANLWTVEALSDELSALADTILRQAMHRAWAHLPKKHTDTPRFAIIGYGKLGGKELGYSSDLDLVYLYDDPHPDAAETYARFANRLTSWLTAATGAGILYDVDLRLRPNGDAGFAATSLEAFRRYQHENAWTWEHQALSRARFICGDAAIGDDFENVRREILMQPRDRQTLRDDIITMREKMFPTHPPHENDIKYARGGVVDVEFLVQYLVLAHAGQYPDLTENFGNIALLRMAAAHGLIDGAQSAAVRSAYREYRRTQHNTHLRDTAFTPDNEARARYAAVRALWQEVMKQGI
ncbi:MAG: bifunctional [glutamate--ammonia ligase]-adenylyl-L-tyrosine phosphorylase/[glutamate--ammonia-ligase] adenylyltransferase [Neisseria sp.]|nr:bifunctional [glutamate--ammonia ligase]-adenylyl-L-tyrosine phosphorylase/[glutamate--ammonia-ligase] adenylyltransferase [Neisseria sp.]